MVTSDGASNVDPFGGPARKGRACVMHGAAMLAGLLLCGGANAQTKDARQQVLPVMPDALIGVWNRNDRDGRLDCEAYRKIESKQRGQREYRLKADIPSGPLFHAFKGGWRIGVRDTFFHMTTPWQDKDRKEAGQSTFSRNVI